MTKLILVRHGETDWNRVDRIQGWLDIPLNKEGIKQAERLAKELSGMKIAAIYSSPLKRAWQTAKAIAERQHLGIKKVSALKEINQGKWQGLLVSEARRRYKRLYSRWLCEPLEVRPPEGESLEEASQRVEKACQRIVANHPQETICLVTHKVTATLIKCHYLGLNRNRLWKLLPDNATWEIIRV
ncbi:histidine phosphatase family protein [candidate division NPL-UPA2 bacterium]|nr:histidine phosphatase family protein [candidate division NPL-UPA2 bacterium]